MSSLDPGRSRGQERGAIDEAVSPISFGESTCGAPLRPTPFQRRGCELPSDLLGPREAFTGYQQPLTLSRSLAGTPESVSIPPDALTRTTLLADRATEISPASRRALARPTREGLTCRNPRTPSVVSRTHKLSPEGQSRAEQYLALCATAHRFAFSPLVLRVRRCFELPPG